MSGYWPAKTTRRLLNAPLNCDRTAAFAAEAALQEINMSTEEAR